MARDVDIERRLMNWARWTWGRSGGYASVGLGAIAVETSYHESRIPIIDHEAQITDRLVHRLDEDLRATVHLVYLECGGTVSQAAAIGLGVGTVQAVHERIGRAHRQLAQWLVERAQQLRAERERVERLTRAAT